MGRFCSREVPSLSKSWLRWGLSWLHAGFCFSLIGSCLVWFEEHLGSSLKHLPILMADFLILFQVTPANPSTLFHDPIPFSPTWEMGCCPCTTLPEPHQCRIPQNKGNSEFVYHILGFITSCWPSAGNTHLKFPQMLVMDRGVFLPQSCSLDLSEWKEA